MKREFSAGGVIIAYKNKSSYILLIKDKKNKWTFPKGLIERGEAREDTAVREVAEEVGIKKLKLIRKLTPVKYFYKWEGKLRQKYVYYYLFENSATEKLKPQHEEGIMAVKWFSFNKALDIIGYKRTNLKILKEAIN